MSVCAVELLKPMRVCRRNEGMNKEEKALTVRSLNSHIRVSNIQSPVAQILVPVPKFFRSAIKQKHLQQVEKLARKFKTVPISFHFWTIVVRKTCDLV